MGCSDVSEFEHIYGQILTTPSCVYGKLFTWTRMVDFNALIMWKTFIHFCFSINSSLWALTDAYTKFRRMIWSMIWSCGHRSRPHICVLLRHRNAGRLHLEKAESIQPCDYRVGQATTGAEAQFWLRQPWRNLPPSSLRLLSLTLLTRVWGITMGKLWN